MERMATRESTADGPPGLGRPRRRRRVAARSMTDGLAFPAISWSLSGEWSARRTAAPGEPTLALPGPSGFPPPLPSAERLAAWGRFGELELAGAGGMARVYRGIDRRRRRPVAVKLLVERRHPGDDLREARLQQAVRHPGVLPVYDRGIFAGCPWFSMPYVNGSTLKAARTRIRLDQALALVADVCRAVAVAHDRGIVHCDVNPRNVLVARTGRGLRAWIIDFGIAREASRPTGTDTTRVFGTPAYMAPEQALGHHREIDPRTDVYGLGATLYELAAGRRPFSAETSAAVLTKAVREEPQPLRELAPEVPPALESLVLRCLEKNPADRYPDARAVATDLDRLLRH